MSSQPPKDFLALSHGEEWVNFYESFDKLVQDHLSRSSELLRKAMSLPEVADREVAQVRAELEGQLAAVRAELGGQLAAEREQHQATLNSLRAEISASHQQAASLARMFGSLLTDLDRLSTTVDSALMAQPAAVSTAPAEKGTGNLVEPAAGVAFAEESAEPLAEGVTEPGESSEWSVEAVATESSEGESESTEGEALSGESQSEIDLNALAAAEEQQTEASSDVETSLSSTDETETNDSTDESDSPWAPKVEQERPRPHWLSVARSNSSH